MFALGHHNNSIKKVTTFKLYFVHPYNEIRKFSLPDAHSDPKCFFSQLIEIFEKMNKNANQFDFKLYYQDEDKEWVRVNCFNEKEWSELFYSFTYKCSIAEKATHPCHLKQYQHHSAAGDEHIHRNVIKMKIVPVRQTLQKQQEQNKMAASFQVLQLKQQHDSINAAEYKNVCFLSKEENVEESQYLKNCTGRVTTTPHPKDSLGNWSPQYNPFVKKRDLRSSFLDKSDISLPSIQGQVDSEEVVSEVPEAPEEMQQSLTKSAYVPLEDDEEFEMQELTTGEKKKEPELEQSLCSSIASSIGDESIVLATPMDQSKTNDNSIMSSTLSLDLQQDDDDEHHRNQHSATSSCILQSSDFSQSKYETAHMILESMGFKDRNLNEKILQSHTGNLENAVAELIEQSK